MSLLLYLDYIYCNDVIVTIFRLEQGELQLDSSIGCLEDYLGFLTHKK